MSQMKVDVITNAAGTGAPTFPFGFSGAASAAIGSDSDTTLTSTSARLQVVTPTADRAYTLPSTGIVLGDTFEIKNNAAVNSGFDITIKSSNGNTIVIVTPQTAMRVTSVLATPVAAADWTALKPAVSYVSFQDEVGTAVGAPGTYADFGNLVLDPGVWLITLQGWFSSVGATVTTYEIGISTTSGNSGAGLLNGDNEVTFNTSVDRAPMAVINWPQVITSQTTYYAKISSNYSGGTVTYLGRFTAVKIG